MAGENIPPSGSRVSPPHILVVEDDPGVLNAMRRLLKIEGYRVAAAPSITEAVKLVRQNDDVDLLVTDFHLGNGELGTEAIVHIRAACRHPVKAVLITGDTSRVVHGAIQDDTVRLITKPINASDFLAVLVELLA